MLCEFNTSIIHSYYWRMVHFDWKKEHSSSILFLFLLLQTITLLISTQFYQILHFIFCCCQSAYFSMFNLHRPKYKPKSGWKWRNGANWRKRFNHWCVMTCLCRAPHGRIMSHLFYSQINQNPSKSIIKWDVASFIAVISDLKSVLWRVCLYV